jgi:hypothetical protein
MLMQNRAAIRRNRNGLDPVGMPVNEHIDIPFFWNYAVQSALLLFRTHTVPRRVFAVARFLSYATVLTKLADFDF